MDISLDFVVDAARRRLATLTPEVAGYVVLLAARELEFRPRRFSPETLTLAEGGEVHVTATEAATPAEVEAALRGLLATLVELTPSPAPAISAVAARSDGIGLAAFAAELAAALIPINHAAAGRALARLYRESQRARVSGLANQAAAPSSRSGEPSAEAARGHTPESSRSVDSSRALPSRAPADERDAQPVREPELLEIDVELDTDVAESGSAPLAPADGQRSAAAGDAISLPDAVAGSGGAAGSQEPEEAPERHALTAEPSEVVLAAHASGLEPRPAPPEPLDVAAAASESASGPLAPGPGHDEPVSAYESSAAEASPPAPESRTPGPGELGHEPARSEPALTPAAAGVALVEPDTASVTPPAQPEVLVPGPVSELAAREREMVVPMAIVDAAPPAFGLAAREREMVVPMAIVDAAPPAGPLAAGAPVELSTNHDEPLLVHPLDAIDAYARGGFARVSWPSLPPANADLSVEDCRSDLQHLLAGFLAEARSEARMARGLRRLLGLERASNGVSRSRP